MLDAQPDARLLDLYDFFQNAPIGVHVLASDGTILFANRADREIAGHTGEDDEYVGKNIAQLHEDPAAIEEMMAQWMDGRPLVNARARLRRPDGSAVAVVVNSNCRMADGAPAAIRCCTFPEGTAARHEGQPPAAAREALEAMSEGERDELLDLLEDLFENAPVGLHIVGPDGLVRRANRIELENLGYTDDPSAYVGHHIEEFHAEKPVIDEMLERLITGRPLVRYPATILHRSGEAKPVVIYSTPRFEDGEFVNTRCFTFPRFAGDAPQPRTFAWPRNDDTAGDAADDANPMTGALKRMAGRRAAEEALGFLAETSKALAATPDHAAAVSELCELAIPFLADWCAVEVGSGDDVQVLAAARGEGITGSDELVRATAVGDVVRDGVAGALRVPFATHDETEGALLLVRAGGRPDFGPADTALAEEVARRVAMAVEAGRLRERASVLA
ncbi:MAG: PAS domain S-box protein [Actinomycetota bacterium]|nr:PAS domain S-box protein [Actinomycetota bacterium]